VARVGRDVGSGHVIVRGSTNVFVEDRNTAFAYDSVNSKGVAIVQGSDTVFVNDKPIARESDSLADGGNITTGSLTVIVEG